MAKKINIKCEEPDPILNLDKCETDAIETAEEKALDESDEDKSTEEKAVDKSVVLKSVEKELPENEASDSKNESSSENILIEEEKQRVSDNTKIFEELEEIRELFSKRFSYDKGKDEAFERLYLELDEVKRNRAFEDSRPLFLDLILFYDRMQTTIIDAESKGTEILDSLQSELKEILYRRGIETINKESDIFEPSLQRAVKTKNVESDELNGKVVRVLREGFVYRGIVLRPEDVVIGSYLPPETNIETDEIIENQNKETE